MLQVPYQLFEIATTKNVTMRFKITDVNDGSLYFAYDSTGLSLAAGWPVVLPAFPDMTMFSTRTLGCYLLQYNYHLLTLRDNYRVFE